jgi:hypothetical protein
MEDSDAWHRLPLALAVDHARGLPLTLLGERACRNLLAEYGRLFRWK